MATESEQFDTSVFCPVFEAHQRVQTSYDELEEGCDSFHFDYNVSSKTMLSFSENWIDVRKLSVECSGKRDMREMTSFWNNVMCTNVEFIAVLDIGFAECVIMMNAFYLFGKRPTSLTIACPSPEALLFITNNYSHKSWITVHE
jgi:hypothetical protein